MFVTRISYIMKRRGRLLPRYVNGSSTLKKHLLVCPPLTNFDDGRIFLTLPRTICEGLKMVLVCCVSFVNHTLLLAYKKAGSERMNWTALLQYIKIFYSVLLQE